MIDAVKLDIRCTGNHPWLMLVENRQYTGLACRSVAVSLSGLAPGISAAQRVPRLAQSVDGLFKLNLLA